MNLADDTELAEAAIYETMMAEYVELFGFDWDAQLAEASVLPEPWQWDWKSALRIQLEQLTGTPDVTGWTQSAGTQLAAVLAAPPDMHASLLGFREAETGLLPAVAGSPSGSGAEAAAASAEGEGQAPHLS